MVGSDDVPANKDIRRIEAWRAAHPDRVRTTNRRHVNKYADSRRGAGAEIRSQLHSAQQGLCAICETDEAERALSLDHCHSCDEIRGLLCRRCNLAIGMFDDDVELLASAITYLRRFTCATNEEANDGSGY